MEDVYFVEHRPHETFSVFVGDDGVVGDEWYSG
jgi:hypothetical protein